MCKEFVQKVQRVMSSATVETAGYIRRLVQIERQVWGDEASALRKVARGCRLSFWTLNNIKIGRAKTVNADVRDRVRAYFINNLREHAARLIHEAETAAKMGQSNDALAGIEREIRALAARLEAAAGTETDDQ
jgi:hypothetical protein